MALAPTGSSGPVATLGQVEHGLHAAHEATAFGNVALGRSPLALAAPVVTTTLKAALGTSDSAAQRAVGHAGLATEALVHGLVGHHGIARSAAEARGVPFLDDRPAPTMLRPLASVLGRLSKGLHVGVLGVGGALGVLRAADAVQGGGSASALLTTQDGRSGTLQAVGSALMLARHPVSMLAGAGVFGAALVNDLL